MRLLIVGRGRLGGAFARGLRARGLVVATTGGRAPSPAALARAEVVYLAVPDTAIATTGIRLLPHLRRGAVVLHAAGNRPADELSALAAAGHPIGVLHPLVSLIGRAGADSFVGTTFFADGSPRARSAARALGRALGARVVVARVHGPVYHAAAAVAANGAAALVYAAQSGLRTLGISARDADRALAGLLASVAHNIAAVGVPAALTGPVVRGDADAVRRHRAALRAAPESTSTLTAAYDAVFEPLLACARAAGLSEASARAIAAAYGDVPVAPPPSHTSSRAAAITPRRRASRTAETARTPAPAPRPRRRARRG